MKKVRLMMSRVLRKGEKDDGSFDIEFWKKLGPEAIFSAAAEMVKEFYYFKGTRGFEPRLQRTTTRTIRRGR